MEYAIIILGIVGLAIWLAYNKGQSDQEVEQHEELVGDVTRSKDLRRRLRNKHFRDKLRKHFK